MAQIVSGSVGPETNYSVVFTGGALQVTLGYAGAQASVSLTGSISAAQLLAAVAAKVTNPAEKDLVLGLEAILNSIP